MIIVPTAKPGCGLFKQVCHATKNAKNMGSKLIDMLSSNEGDAFYADGVWVSYRELLESIRGWNEIATDLSIKNSVVAIVGNYSKATLSLIISMFDSDNIVVPLKADNVQNDDYLKISRPDYIFQDGKLRRFENLGPTECDMHPIICELKANSQAGLIIFSSGSTGKPKAMVQTVSPILEKIVRSGKRLEYNSVLFLTFDHFGGFNTWFTYILTGSPFVCINDASVDVVCNIIQNFKIGLLPTTPSFLNMMLATSAFKRFDLSSLKLITYGTEPISDTTLKKVSELLPDVYLKQTYGMSEIGVISTKSKSRTSPYFKISSSDVEHKIINGVLFIKSKMNMKGYMNHASPFDSVGWINTRDLVDVDIDGYIRIVGRESEQINVGGLKVLPIEVEDVILQLDFVHDVSVFGTKNEMLGEIVTAKIILRKGLSGDAQYISYIRKHCVAKLERHKIPVKIIIEAGSSLVSERMKKVRR